MNEWQRYLDDNWWMWVWHNFSFMMIAIPAALAALLKIIAKVHPSVPCNEIMELLKVFFARPGTIVTERHTESSKVETKTESTTTEKPEVTP